MLLLVNVCFCWFVPAKKVSSGGAGLLLLLLLLLHAVPFFARPLARHFFDHVDRRQCQCRYRRFAAASPRGRLYERRQLLFTLQCKLRPTRQLENGAEHGRSLQEGREMPATGKHELCSNCSRGRICYGCQAGPVRTSRQRRVSMVYAGGPDRHVQMSDVHETL